MSRRCNLSVVVVVVGLLSFGVQPIHALSSSSSSAASVVSRVVQQQPKTTTPVYLSDLPTPSFIVDIHALFTSRSKQQSTSTTKSTQQAKSSSIVIPPIRLSSLNQLLVVASDSKVPSSLYTFDASLDPIDLFVVVSNDDATTTSSSTLPQAASGDICYCYIHCTVTKSIADESIETTTSTTTEASSTTTPASSSSSSTGDTEFLLLAEVDIPTDLPTSSHLVLGLNNHHVGSYYWARSAGSGAAMEAPGIVLRHGNQLQWESSSYVDCNSNDGKRSEWVRFLRRGDQIQLRPTQQQQQRGGGNSIEDALVALSPRIYGISSWGRPLGSEPLVVCQWSVVDDPSDPKSRTTKR